MTPEQIKRHAEEVLRDKGSTAGAIYVAEAYLAEHDETPVDEDFLREQGFDPVEGQMYRSGRVSVSSECLYLHGIYSGPVRVCDNPTRGDVLRLLSVVGRGE